MLDRHRRARLAIAFLVIAVSACGKGGAEGQSEELSEMAEFFNRDVPCADPCPAGEAGTTNVETFDGLSYELSAEGDYVMAASTDGSVIVQARLGHETSTDRAITNVAVVLTDYPVEIEGDGSLRIDGRIEEIPSGSYIPLIDQAAIFRDGETYILAWPGDGDNRFRLDVTLSGGGLRLTPFLPPEMAGSLAGLLGDGDGVGSNDLTSRDGKIFQLAPGSRQAPPEFVQSWAVAPEKSLFGCEPGEFTSKNDFDQFEFGC